MNDIKTVKEILNEEDKEDLWIWDHIIKEKTINIISGDESSGKTTLMVNLCKAISDQEDFLGYKTNKQRILYMSSEMPKKDISKTFEAIGLRNMDNIKVIELTNDPLSFLEYKIYDVDLIIIDLFVQILINEDKDPNVYKDINEIYARLRDRFASKGKTVILVHHLNKLGEINGSVSMGGASDTRMIFSMPEGRQSSERLLSIYGKSVEQREINICFEFSSRLMKLSERSESSKIDYELAYIIEQVIRHKEVSGNCQQVSAALKLSKFGRNPKSLTKYLNGNIAALEENDIVFSTDRSSKERIISLKHKQE